MGIRKNYGNCIKFEDLPLGSKFHVKDTFLTSGISVDILPYRWGNNVWTSGGYATIENYQKSGGTGQEIWTNNVNLGFKLHNLKYGLRLLYGVFGGDLNISINGKFTNFLDFADLPKLYPPFPGVKVDVFPSWQPNRGLLVIQGKMNESDFREKGKYTLVIGGQELAIDNVCLLKK